MLSLSLVLISGLAAQTGPSRWGSIKTFGFGSVNRAVLDNRFAIPIYSRPTVGEAEINLQLRYDSQFWKVGANGWAPGLNGVYNGWQIWVPFGQIYSDQSIEYSYCGWQNNVTGQLDQWYNLVTDDYSFVEPDGTQVLSGLPENQYYQLGGGSRQRGDENTCYTIQQGPSTVTIPDGKGYTAVLSNQGYSTAQLGVYNSAGDQISNAFVDINASKVTSTTSGGVTTYTDPLGTVVTQSGSGTPASPIVYAYTGAGGAPVDITEQFTTLSVATSFGCSGINEWSGSLTVPSALQLPDGRSYTFAYDNNGQISSVTLPTGAVIHYSYHVDCASRGSTNASLTRWDSVEQRQRLELVTRG